MITFIDIIGIKKVYCIHEFFILFVCEKIKKILLSLSLAPKMVDREKENYLPRPFHCADLVIIIKHLGSIAPYFNR